MMAGGERILSPLNIEVEVRDVKNAVEIKPIVGGIKFEKVSFHYSDEPTLVLGQIDLEAEAGQAAALVGETGAGKTIIVKLLTCFHDPTDDCVCV